MPANSVSICEDTNASVGKAAIAACTSTLCPSICAVTVGASSIIAADTSGGRLPVCVNISEAAPVLAVPVTACLPAALSVGIPPICAASPSGAVPVIACLDFASACGVVLICPPTPCGPSTVAPALRLPVTKSALAFSNAASLGIPASSASCVSLLISAATASLPPRLPAVFVVPTLSAAVVVVDFVISFAVCVPASVDLPASFAV